METDFDYKNRLINCDGVNHYWSEDIGNASGKDLDLIGEYFDCPRLNKTQTSN